METQLEVLINPISGSNLPRDRRQESAKIVECGQCYAKILEREAYISPGGHPYCNQNCFVLFTED